jgi:hypothetical protein
MVSDAVIRAVQSRGYEPTIVKDCGPTTLKRFEEGCGRSRCGAWLRRGRGEIASFAITKRPNIAQQPVQFGVRLGHEVVLHDH